MKIKTLKCGCEYQVEGNVEIRIKTCEEHTLVQDLQGLKEQKINEIRQKTKITIQSIYSIEEQINCLNLLNGRSEIEKTDCIEYIENISLQGQQFQGEILALTEIEDIQNYTFEFITE